MSTTITLSAGCTAKDIQAAIARAGSDTTIVFPKDAVIKITRTIDFDLHQDLDRRRHPGIDGRTRMLDGQCLH